MDFLLWSALSVGFLGSFHCVGMCGPIALALPNPGSHGRGNILIGRLLYNCGRVITYSILGFIVGLLGLSIAHGGWQSNLSILAGILIILSVFITSEKFTRFFNTKLVGISFGLKKYFGLMMKKHSYSSLFGIGLLNGILPCGFVYLALAAATTTGNPFTGMFYMFLFGIGTIPMMLLLSLTGNLISAKTRTLVNKLTPAIAIIIGLFLIQRGVILRNNDDCCTPGTSVNMVNTVPCK